MFFWRDCMRLSSEKATRLLTFSIVHCVPLGKSLQVSGIHSVCKYVCLEEGGGEIPGHQRFIRLIYKALGKGGPERWRAVETQEKPERGGERERERGKIWES